MLRLVGRSMKRGNWRLIVFHEDDDPVVIYGWTPVYLFLAEYEAVESDRADVAASEGKK